MAAIAHKGQIIMGGDAGVTSWNGRTGSVLPIAGDYDATQINYDSQQNMKQRVDAVMSAAESLTRDTTGWTGKNLLKNTAESGSYQGITYTVNSDKSITINGTNTDSVKHSFMVGIVTLDAGDYKVNGLKNNGGYTSFWINLYNLTDSSNINVINANEDVMFTLSAPKQVKVTVYWAGNATVSNITIYPMIRKADITDSTYEPYHKSVLEELSSRISTFNGRSGSVLPMAGDYDATQVNYSSQQTMKQKIDAVAGVWTSAVNCLVGDTTCTVSNSAIHTTSIIDDVFTQTSSGNVIAYTNVAVTEGRAVITWASALTEAVSVKLHVLNL